MNGEHERPLRQPYIVGAGRLMPEDYEARTALSAIPVGEKVEVIIYRQRNPSFARLVYKTFNLVGDAMKWRARNVRGWLAVKTGRADLVAWPPTGGHKVMTIPHGTGPTDMSQLELSEFWDDAKVVIREQVIPYASDAQKTELEARLASSRDWDLA